MKEPMFQVKEEKGTDDFGRFVIEPLDTGFGHTLGNALRRVLLTSIAGAAVTSVLISGVKHRFSTVPGLKENVVDFLLNIKGLGLTLSEVKQNATLTLSVKGDKGEIKAKDIELADGVEIADKEYYLGYLSGKKSKLEMEMSVEKGYGYSLAEERKIATIGVIPTDAIFTPVKRVSYEVEATRVGRQTNLDKLVIDIWTDGTITPRIALEEASRILTSYFTQVYQPKTSVSSQDDTVGQVVPEAAAGITLDELDLPTRIYNSLKNGGIETVLDLLKKSRKELMGMRNMGAKSIAIIEKKLRSKDISLSE
ncbi:MAG: DNA-directed RNA polymerase subunit alpha [Candidatus Levybacteria bacterium RIFCSPHIGHO2_02_FULL_42_12]|nr:MAG: DNA-directed RNA polymerase subunit alpha [Candidatus Levybacteria bacterium RIFCSPHIGHO2_02_FULL_42_12]